MLLEWTKDNGSWLIDSEMVRGNIQQKQIKGQAAVRQYSPRGADKLRKLAIGWCSAITKWQQLGRQDLSSQSLCCQMFTLFSVIMLTNLELLAMVRELEGK